MLGLVEHLLRWDVVSFSEKQVVLHNWLCGAAALAGLVAQFWLTRGGGKKEKSTGKGKGKGLPFAELVRGSWLPRVSRKAA